MNMIMIRSINGNRRISGTKSFHTMIRRAVATSSGDVVCMTSIIYFTFDIHPGR